MTKHIKKHFKMGLGYLMDIATGHYKSKVLFVAMNLRIFTRLSKQSKTMKDIAAELNISARPANMLLNACVSLQLLEKKNGLFSNSRTADFYLVEGTPNYMEPAFFKFDEHSYLLFDKLEEAILTDSAQISTKNLEDPELMPSCMLLGNKDDYRKFLLGLDPIARWPAALLADNFDFSTYKRLLDLGGGSGVYSRAIVRKHSNIRVTVFDLPYVCEIGREIIEVKGLSDRIEYLSGDYFNDDFPHGYDVILVSNILHGYGPETCKFLLKKIFDSLPKGGTIIVSDLILDEDGCGPEIAVLMSFYFLLITEEGRNYTLAEYEGFLKKAGFKELAAYKSSGETTFVTGRKI